ncbi:MAG: BamA/TamA family outer membrane protein [Myxococcota bacterium]|nr:BamA/TamA family outer membrane protein [Myxococcota bacterium]
MRSNILAIVLLLLGASACGEKKPPRKPGEDYLKKIDVEGNQQITDRELVSGLALQRMQRRGRDADPYLIQVDGDRIRGEYLRKGFLGVDVRSRVDRQGLASTVVYSVDEGKRATTRVVIKGLPEDAELTSKVRAMLPLRDGEPFDYAKYEAAKPMLMAVVEDAGYARAKLKPTVWADRASSEAIVELVYDLGPKCKFGKIEITGVDGKLAEAVRNRVYFKTGETYSTRAIAKTQRHLYGLQRFSTVQVQPDDDVADPVVDVKIAVSEAARREIKLGGGFGIDPTAYEIRGRSGYSITGFPTQMDTLTLDFRPAYGYLRNGAGWEPRVRALARIERQDILWSYSRGEVEAGYNYIAVEAFTSYGPRGKLGFATPFFLERLQLRLAWSIESLKFRNISPLLDDSLRMDLRLDETNRIAAYQQSLSIDYRDNPIDTHSGIYAELRTVEGTKYAGGNFDYFEVIPEVRGFVPVPVGGIVLASKVRLGAFWGDVPATERFMSGGASNHRGFGERNLSPFVRGEVMGSDTTVPYGGSSMVETSLEARIPLTTWRKMGVGTVLFVDGGDVTQEVGDVDLTNLHWAVGVGLRLLTVVGPIRADLGYRVNRTGDMEPSPGSRFAFHLSIGEAF